MIMMQWQRVLIVLLCIGASFAWSLQMIHASRGVITTCDFGEIYYGARSVWHGSDPYSRTAVLKEFTRDGLAFPTDSFNSKVDRIVIAVGVNLPTALLLVSPLAFLPWSEAQMSWLSLTAFFIGIAAFLSWKLAEGRSPLITASLVCIVLLNCVQVLWVGNAAGIAVSLCVIAFYLFLRRRYEFAACLLLAISLAIKPHDSGFLWLFLALAGGALRKRALQTLILVGILGLIASVWVSRVSPRWAEELHQNHILVAAPGGTSDPAPTGLTAHSAVSIIDLQAVLSIFRIDPALYNLMSFAIGGGLILIWAIAVLRKKRSYDSSLLAIAAISVLTLLPVYHRSYDAKLLMLTFPACAMLWGLGGKRGWLAVAITFAAVLSTSEIPISLWLMLCGAMHIAIGPVADKMAAEFLLQPAPPILLLTGCFYLWVFISYVPSAVSSEDLSREGDAASMTHS